MVRNTRSGLIGDPIHHPSFASVVGKRSFKMRRIASELRPIKSHKELFAIKIVLCVKFAVSILELSDLRYGHHTIFTIGPVQPPLAGLRIEQTQSEAFDVTCWTVDLERVQLRATVPELVADAGSVQIDPGR